MPADIAVLVLSPQTGLSTVQGFSAPHAFRRCVMESDIPSSQHISMQDSPDRLHRNIMEGGRVMQMAQYLAQEAEGEHGAEAVAPAAV